MKRGAPLRRKTPFRARPLLPPVKRGCCGKTRFATREAAEAALYRITRNPRSDQYPQRAYEFKNGWWHLTKQGARETGPDRTTRELVLERDDYACACCGNSVLYGPYSLQHRAARGMGGTSRLEINSPVNLITLCGSATSPGGCHLACEQREIRLNELGFWLRSGQDPATTPVAHAGYGWVLLLPDGDVRVLPLPWGGAP